MTRKASCDNWHPDTPERIASQKSGRFPDGSYRQKTVCLECQRIKVALHRIRGPYGCLPRLMWAPPQL